MELIAQLVSFRYPRQRLAAVASASIRVQRGERVAILGESASGKSTFLGLLSGLLLPTEGKVLLKDQDVHDIPAHKRKFALVLQRPPVLPKTTVNDLLLRPAQREAAEVKPRFKVDEVLGDFGLEGLGQKRLSNLSGGQLQLVHLARCLVWKPDFLLLDEPFNSVDGRLKSKIYPIIRRHQAACNSAMILITHDPVEGLLLCDRVVVMQKGRILANLTAKELLEAPPNVESARLVYGFAANFLEVSVDEETLPAISMDTIFGRLDGQLRCNSSAAPLLSHRRVLGLFPWREVFAVDVKANEPSSLPMFRVMDPEMDSGVAPVMYVDKEITVYGLPPSHRLFKARLNTAAQRILLYDKETGDLIGNVVLSKALQNEERLKVS